MKLKLIPVPSVKKNSIIGDVPTSNFGKTVSPDILELRNELFALKPEELVQFDIGDGENYEIKKRNENGRVTGTNKFKVRYPIKAKFQTAVKYVNDNSKDGSKLFFLNTKDANYIIKIGADVLNNKKYQLSRGFRNGNEVKAFDISQWRRDKK